MTNQAESSPELQQIKFSERTEKIIDSWSARDRDKLGEGLLNVLGFIEASVNVKPDSQISPELRSVQLRNNLNSLLCICIETCARVDNKVDKDISDSIKEGEGVYEELIRSIPVELGVYVKVKKGQESEFEHSECNTPLFVERFENIRLKLKGVVDPN